MFSLVYTRDGAPVRHVLSAGDTVVGRASVCDLVIDDPSISRRHARFRVHGPQCHITELGGRNGTFINGRQIAEGPVSAGDTVVLGRVAMHVQIWDPLPVAISEHHELDDAATTVQRLVPGPSLASPEVAPDLDPRRLLGLVRELAAHVVGWQSLDDALERIVRVAFATTPAERLFVLLIDEHTGARVPCAARMRDDSAMAPTSLNRAVIDRVIETREAMIAGDAPVDPGTGSPGGMASSQRSFICAPLATPARVAGVIYADVPRAQPFTVGDLRVLEALAVYAAAVIEQCERGRMVPDRPPGELQNE